MNILLKLPNSLSERFLTFPMLHMLDKYLRETSEDGHQIHLMSEASHIDCLNLLPFKAYYHAVESADLKTIFTVHRVCSALKLANDIDVFISTTESFVDASIGKNIGAKNKVGFAVGKNSWFFNRKVSKGTQPHMSLTYTQLLSPLMSLVPKIPYVKSRDLEVYYPEWAEQKYIVIDLGEIGEEVNPEWKELFNLSEGMNYVLFSSKEDTFTQELRVNSFMENLSEKNNYQFFKYESNIELARVIKYSECFITSNEGLMHLGSYCEALVYYIVRGTSIKFKMPEYFRGEVVDFSYRQTQDSDFLSLVFDKILTLVNSIHQDKNL